MTSNASATCLLLSHFARLRPYRASVAEGMPPRARAKAQGRHAAGRIRPVALMASTVFSLLAVTVALPVVATGEPLVVDFEGIALSQSNEYGSFYNGADLAGGFSQHGVHFRNEFTDFGDFYVWDGWAVSSSTDTSAAGFANQYSVFAGGGAPSGYVGSGGQQIDTADPDSQFGILFGSQQGNASVEFPGPSMVSGMFVTNTTYAALSMLEGDGFAKKFGGPTGEDPDYFRLTITGLDGLGQPTGQEIVYLADYRTDQDVLLDQWQWVDLTGLGDRVEQLEFLFESTDVGQFGMNTPAYAAIDNLTFIPVPEPSFSLAVCAALAGLALFRRR